MRAKVNGGPLLIRSGNGEMVNVAVRMSDTDNTKTSQLTQLMGRVFESNACEAFGDFITRRIALGDLAPMMADEALLDGIEESPDGGAAMAEAHLTSLPGDARDALLDRASTETGRRLHAAAVTLLAAVDAARLPVEVTPEMVAAAAVTELGDSIPLGAPRS
jgi:hypothetical protein